MRNIKVDLKKCEITSESNWVNNLHFIEAGKDFTLGSTRLLFNVKFILCFKVFWFPKKQYSSGKFSFLKTFLVCWLFPAVLFRRTHLNLNVLEKIIDFSQHFLLKLKAFSIIKILFRKNLFFKVIQSLVLSNIYEKLPFSVVSLSEIGHLT